MRTTSCAARGRPLAALLFLIGVLMMSWAVAVGQSVYVNQTVEWSEDQEVTGLGGEPGLADVTLHIEGLGPENGYPIDCVLIIDVSATADLATAKSFAFDLIDRFSDEDRLALVSFATTARLEVPFTSDRTALKTAIADLAVGGKSALGLAMQMARRELLQVGRDDAILAEILLADGQSNTGLDPSAEGEIAAETGIHIVSVGIGNLINQNLLQAFASETDGLFYRRPSDEALQAIGDHFEDDIAASEIRIDKRLPEGLRFVSASPTPSKVETLSDGSTSVIWQIVELAIGQEITIEMQIEALETGAWAREADSLLTYADFRGVVGSISIPVVNWPPIASFEYEPEAPTTIDVIEFTDLSEDATDAGEIVAWHWDFGDGSVSLEQNPAHRYAESGVYTVRMTVVDDLGGVSTDYVMDVDVAEPFPPVAAFDYSPIEPTTADIVVFADQSFHPQDDLEIVLWEWDFDDGSVGMERNPEHRFVEQGTYTIRLTVTDNYGAVSGVFAVDVTIGNTPPYASFSTRRSEPVADVDADIMTADRPRVGVEILLDASGSYDLDDSIVWYLWDFDGDGLVDETTEVPEVEHTFDEPGEHLVVLTVVDEQGAQTAMEKTINVIAPVTSLRTIETGLPDDWTIPSGVVQVTLKLELNTTLNGLSITETIPMGWTFASIENDGATLRKNGETIEWLFLEKFIPDGVNSKREIRYTLTAPASVGETLQATISGKMGSSSPRFSQAISGEDRVTATSVLSVPVVISRWDVAAEAIDPHLGETIGFDQIQYAVSLWVSGGAVPNTGNQSIDLAMIQDLIAYWLTGSSVHDPLP